MIKYHMLFLQVFVASVVCACEPTVGFGQDESVDKQKVQQCLRDLDSDSLAKRELAEKQLIEMGDAILPMLDETPISASAETKTRLSRIRHQLQVKQINEFVKSKSVSLKGIYDIGDAFAAIEKQTGNKYSGYQERDINLKLDLEDVPCLEAVDRILDDAKLQIDPYQFAPGAHTLRARPIAQMDRSGFGTYASAFRVEATQIDAVRDLRNPELSGMRIQLEVGWEPRIHPIAIELPTENIKMLDEFGDDIGVQLNGLTISNDVLVDAPLSQLVLPAELPDHETWKISKMVATMNVLLPGPVKTFKFDKIGDSIGKTIRVGDAQVKLENVSDNVDIHGVVLRLEFDQAANALESYRGWIFNNKLSLVGADGKKFAPIGSETMAQDQNYVTIQYLFDLDVDPKTLSLEYTSPTAIIKVPVKFELKNIELP